MPTEKSDRKWRIFVFDLELDLRPHNVYYPLKLANSFFPLNGWEDWNADGRVSTIDAPSI